MTTLDTKDGKIPPPAATVERSTDTAALITEQQVMFASAPVLAPKTHSWSRAAHAVTAPLHAFFRPQAHVHNHYPQRFGYLENSAMSREMDRL
jgi:hypothetical protein